MITTLLKIFHKHSGWTRDGLVPDEAFLNFVTAFWHDLVA